ncbi:serine--tRNA ligase [Papillibacter cinnamivorans]|uniref:Serine--tRNA ligase n=1 Tax=Papillibacter cinnamivorans DSM 12816 TaxID=1122930 RepID=A0A1W2A8Q3_9FIRM|nr:serine--tRNA ligase [Papillibacter cinnamivorans]SMC57026.1 seryl-tRNA synthetase [Papillibacter cinnamivorans DSM 12816]
MLDIKAIKSDPDKIKARLSLRSEKYAADIDRALELDLLRRELIFKTESMKAEQNAVSKNIPAMKRAGEDTSSLFAEMKKLADEVKLNDVKTRQAEEELNSILLSVPNLPDESVPMGRDSDENVEMRRWGEPTSFSFLPKAHWDLGDSLGILDPVTAAKVSGARFHFYRGMGAALERSVISYYLDVHTSVGGYEEILPPYMVNRASMTGTGQLPKFEEDAYKVIGKTEADEYFLIPTAEVPVTNMYRDDILDGARLPLKYCAYSACFRAEAGSAGRDTRGLIRQHQFNKVELVKFSHPEHSFEELERLTADAERVLQGLGLPYRVVLLCSGDLGFSSAKTYDIEVWMPSYGRYVEISSCSNFLDFQARRANIRFRDDKTGKPSFVHTLNGSGVAVGRTVAAILENYQNEDGTVTIPEALRPYLHGKTKIGG